jgi:membrane protein
MLQKLLAQAWKSRYGTVPTVTSILAIAFGASAAFAQLHTATNSVWHQPKDDRKESMRDSIRTLLHERLISFALVVALGFLMILLLVVDAVIQIALHWLVSSQATMGSVLHLIRAGLVPLVLALVFGILLRILPDAPLRARDVWPGALVSAALFLAGKGLLTYYVVRAGTANMFGAAGSLAVLLLWLYYSAAIFLYGAHFAAAWTRVRGD